MRLAAIGVICVALVVPEAAFAGTASTDTYTVRAGGGGGTSLYTFTTATYTAAPGESNVVTASADSDGFNFRDDGAEVTPGPGCQSIDAHSVRCEKVEDSFRAEQRTELGDGADWATSPGGDVVGGAGDDLIVDATRLEGGPGDDVLIAGRGDNELFGGDGRDRLVGGPDHDALRGDDRDPAPDVIDGGGGKDTVSWRAHDERVVVDLADPAPDGAAGEGDELTDVENLAGGLAGDVLRGDGGRNRIFGGRGDDRLAGGGGADELEGNRGNDRAAGNGGNDVIRAEHGYDRVAGGAGGDTIELGSDALHTSDAVTCGPGRDRVDDPQASDYLPPDCERIVLGSSPVTLVARGRASLVFEVGEYFTYEDATSDCGLFRLGDRDGSLGTVNFRVPSRRGRTVRVRLPLSALGRAVRARPGLTPATLRFTSDARGCPRGRPPDLLEPNAAYTLGL